MSALNERVHYVVHQLAPDAVAVSVLGSFADGGKRELSLFLAEWQSGRAGLDVEIEVDALRAVIVLPIPLPQTRRNVVNPETEDPVGTGRPAVCDGNTPETKPVQVIGLF